MSWRDKIRQKESEKKKRKDLRVGADELDMRQLDPLQSVCPPMPDRKHRERNSLFLSRLQQNDKYAVHQTPNVLMYNTESAAPYVVYKHFCTSFALEVKLGT